MGKSARCLHQPYLPPLPPPRLPPVDEAVIAPGGAIRAIWDLRGGHGATIEVANVGSAACECQGRRLAAGETVGVPVPDGTRQCALVLDSDRGTRVRLTVKGWRPAPPPTYILSRRKVIERDPKTQVIKAIVEVPTWIRQEPR